MKIFKILLKGLAILIGIVVLFITIVILADNYNTRFLKLKNIPNGETNTYLITNVNVVPMTKDTILKHKMVLIRDGLIRNISDTIRVQNVAVFDGKNKYLSPGLIDMHVHVWDNYELGLYLANGVTAVRNVWGMPMHLRMKNAINNNKIIAPSFFTTGPKLTGPEFIGDDNLQLYNPEEAREKVISYKERGYDFLKTYYGLTPEIYDAIIDQAKKSNMDIVAHPSQKVPYSYHFNPQIKSIEHAEDIVQEGLNYALDTTKLNVIVNEFKKAKNSSFCPTLTVYHNIFQMLVQDDILSAQQLRYLNPLIQKVDSKGQFDRWQATKHRDSSITTAVQTQHEFHLMTVKRLYDTGVNIICGTDAGIGVTAPGLSIQKELAFYHEAGLSNYEALKTATANPSKVHKIMADFGTIESGKIANLLLLNSNPLKDLTALKTPSSVFVYGRKLDRNTLDDFEKRGKNRKNFLASGLRYIENLIIEK